MFIKMRSLYVAVTLSEIEAVSFRLAVIEDDLVCVVEIEVLLAGSFSFLRISSLILLAFFCPIWWV